MKLTKFKIANFRGYQKETVIDFENLTAFVGKNDVGKSTVLEALDIFFNSGNGIIKQDKDDINKTCSEDDNTEIVLTACFSDLPSTLTLDATHSTSLADEYLLNADNELEVVKKYEDAGKEKVFIRANHPTNVNCAELFTKKNADLKKILDKNNIPCDNKTINSTMRKAIWEYYRNDLQLKERELVVSTKGDDGINSIWDNLKEYLPIYSLFQADRKNSDTDEEVQDPLQTAVEQILSAQNVKSKLKEISDIVLTELKRVASETLKELQKINPVLASTLLPKIPEIESLKWKDVFKKVSISSNDNIPINKRGSGVKRLILLSFFQAEANKKKDANNNRGIIYAIEEPETSQHFEHQKILIKALKFLSKNDNTQVVLTTHSSLIVKDLSFSNIRLIQNVDMGKEIKLIEKKYLPSPSLNEVNYLALGEITTEYHDELYGYLQTKAMDENIENCRQKNFDDWLKSKGVDTNKKWIRIQKDGSETTEETTLCTYIRNRVHHPENTKNNIETPEEIKQSIEIMQQLIES